MRFVFIAICLAGFVSGCALQPTKTKEVVERKYDTAGQIVQPIKITEQTVIVDARPAFDYSMAHVPRSVNLQWTDFTQPDPEKKGVLQADLFSIARRLARLGIGSDTPVLVVGKGLSADGEEGRVAWTLAYLGVKNVQFSEMDSLKFRLTNSVEQNPPAGVPPWKPEPVEDLNATHDELIQAINRNATSKPMAYAGAAPVLYQIVDVRSAADYLGREGFGAKSKLPNMGAINIPWREFFDKNLRPRQEIAAKLKEVGVSRENRIIVVDEDGLSSSDVTMALRGLGFSHAGNLSGGLIDVLSAYGTSR